MEEKIINDKVAEIENIASKIQNIITDFSSLELKSDGKRTHARVDGKDIGKKCSEIIYIHKVGEIEPTIILNGK